MTVDCSGIVVIRSQELQRSCLALEGSLRCMCEKGWLTSPPVPAAAACTPIGTSAAATVGDPCGTAAAPSYSARAGCQRSTAANFQSTWSPALLRMHPGSGP